MRMLTPTTQIMYVCIYTLACMRLLKGGRNFAMKTIQYDDIFGPHNFKKFSFPSPKLSKNYVMPFLFGVNVPLVTPYTNNIYVNV